MCTDDLEILIQHIDASDVTGAMSVIFEVYLLIMHTHTQTHTPTT